MSRGSRQGALERPRCRQKVLPCLDLRAGTLSSSMLAQAWRCEPISPVTGSKPRASTFHFSLINLWVAKARHRLGACHRLHPGSYVLSLDLDWHRPVLTAGLHLPHPAFIHQPLPLPWRASRTHPCPWSTSGHAGAAFKAAFVARHRKKALDRKLWPPRADHLGRPQRGSDFSSELQGMNQRGHEGPLSPWDCSQIPLLAHPHPLPADWGSGSPGQREGCLICL